MSDINIAEAFEQHLRSLTDVEWAALTRRVRGESTRDLTAQLLELGAQADANGFLPATASERQQSAAAVADLSQRLGFGAGSENGAHEQQGLTPNRAQGAGGAAVAPDMDGADARFKADRLRELHRQQNTPHTAP